MSLAAGPVPMLASHQLLVFLLQVALLLAAATALGTLAARLGLPAVVGRTDGRRAARAFPARPPGAQAHDVAVSAHRRARLTSLMPSANSAPFSWSG